MSASTSKEPQRIAKLLARAGIASRREIERMIAEGRIALNGQILDTPATLLASLHGVTVDGNPVAAPAPARLFVFHKPTGLLTTERDPAGRRTIYDVLPDDLPRLMPVGRLDLNTEGLLLMTTDGELKRELELPATGVERTYRARAYGAVSQAQLEELIEGIEIDGIRYGSIDANLERRTGANSWIEMTLTEGKNREVRRVLEHLGLEVSRLIRVRYGPFVLGDMPAGAIGEVRQHDLIAFRKTLKLPAAQRKYDAVEARIAKPAAAEAPASPEPARPARSRVQPDKPMRARSNDRAPMSEKPARAARARAFREAHGEELPARGRDRAGKPDRSPKAEGRVASARGPRNATADRSGRPQRPEGPARAARTRPDAGGRPFPSRRDDSGDRSRSNDTRKPTDSRRGSDTVARGDGDRPRTKLGLRYGGADASREAPSARGKPGARPGAGKPGARGDRSTDRPRTPPRGGPRRK